MNLAYDVSVKPKAPVAPPRLYSAKKVRVPSSPSSRREEASNSPSTKDWMGPSSPRTASGVLVVINESTKWIVSAAAGIFLVLHHDVPVLWCILGSIVSSFFNKGLKLIINQQRPVHAQKADPGMPSSHANSLAFLGVYSATSLGLIQSSYIESLCAIGLLAGSAFLTWLRVALGYHTLPQVVAGYALGSATALGWLQLGQSFVLPLLLENSTYSKALTGVTYLAAAAFILRNLLGWIKGFLHLRQGVKVRPAT